VQLPTAILKNLPAYLAYVDGIRADVSELNKLITAVWDGFAGPARGGGAARSGVCGRGVHHHHGFLRAPSPRDAPHGAHNHERGPSFFENSEVKPQSYAIKTRVFSGLRAIGIEAAAVAPLEAAYNGWWEGTATEPGMRVNAVAAWQEATQVGTWCLVSPFLRAAAPVMLATHLRNLDKGCVCISELEYAPINADFVESGFAHSDRATRTHCGAGIDSCIGVAHASMLGAFQTYGGRCEAAKMALRTQQRATVS
jgi:hypothetical protein